MQLKLTQDGSKSNYLSIKYRLYKLAQYYFCILEYKISTLLIKSLLLYTKMVTKQLIKDNFHEENSKIFIF